jgi:hypothetical protein
MAGVGCTPELRGLAGRGATPYDRHMSSRRSDVEARRASRSRWPVTRHRLGEETSDDLSDTTTAEERIAMMAELAETAWTVAGRTLPSYERHSMPGRLFVPGQPRPDDE